MTKNLNIIFSDHCLEHWALSDLRRSIENPINTFRLSEFGWTVDMCGNARKGNYHISNKGELTITSEFQSSLEFDEWRIDLKFIKRHPKIYSELIQIQY